MATCRECVTKPRYEKAESVTKRRNNVTPVTKLVPTPVERAESREVVQEVRRGRPRVHSSNAERQAAYRERRQ